MGSNDVFSVIVFDLVGTKFAVDLEQVSEITEYKSRTDVEIPLVQVAKTELFQGQDLKYRSLRLLKIKGEKVYGILIDQPEDIVTLTIERIMALPKLLMNAMPTSPIWGAFMIKEKIIFLLDCYKLKIP